MKEWENTPVASKTNALYLIVPKNNAYKLGNQIIYSTHLLNVDPFRFHWETRVAEYYEKIIRYCIQRRWQLPCDLYKHLQVYPRFHDNKMIISACYVDTAIHKKIINLLTIKRHDLFNPKICIKNQKVKLNIGKIPSLPNSKCIPMNRCEPIITTLPAGDIVQVRKIYDYL